MSVLPSSPCPIDMDALSVFSNNNLMALDCIEMDPDIYASFAWLSFLGPAVFSASALFIIKQEQWM